jgi:hypothetical protein
MKVPFLDQIVSYAKGIRADLANISSRISSMSEAIHDLSRAISNQAERFNEQRDRANDKIVASSELNVTEDEKRKRRVQRTQHNCQQWLLVIGTWAAVLAAAVYALLAYYQWQEMIPATNAAIHSARTVANQLAFEERPWIAIENGSNGGIVPYGFHDLVPAGNETGVNVGTSSADFYFSAFIKNYGNSPANVTFDVKVVDRQYFKGDDTGEKRHLTVKDYCKRDRWADAPKAGTIMPGATVKVGLHPRSPLWITKGMREREDIRPSILGCIWYQSAAQSTEDRANHRAQFSGDIFSAPPSAKHELPLPVTPGHIPPEQLKIENAWMIGETD